MKKKLLALLISILIIFSAIPFGVFAAPASDILAEMLDNLFLDALAYAGYNVNAQKNDGTIFKKYSSSVAAAIRSKIGYGTGPSGTETVAKSGTATGNAPDIPKFEQNGLCCASYISYVYFNYLPNIAGVDVSGVTRPSNYRAAISYNTLADSWVNSGTARRISFTQNSNSFTPAEKIPIGSLIIFKDSSGTVRHVAIYAGAYGGKNFITHVGNENGPEFCTIEGMLKSGLPQTVNQIVVPNFVNPNGIIEVRKTDTDGNSLAGAYFVATLVTDSEKQYLIGPTDNNGYAKTAGNVPYGTYTVKETVFPTNYRSYGQNEWTVTVGSENKGVASFSAINELIPGGIKIIKASEDGNISGINFNVSGNGIDRDAVTDINGEITIDGLRPGLYTVTEKVSEVYIPQISEQVTVISGKTATVHFNNKLKRGNLTVTKNAEDGFTEGLSFGITGISLSGKSVEMYAVSNAEGKAYFTGIPIGSYKLFELNTPQQYVIPAELDITVKWNETAETVIYNALKKWRAEIRKADSELGNAQGDAVLEGAVYGLFKDGILLKEYSTDKNGYILTDFFPCGTGYYLKELKPSKGYLIDRTVHNIGADAALYSAEYNKIYLNCYEAVIKSNVTLIKHSDDGSTQIETPEAGAKFQLYLKSAGSYSNAKEREKDLLTVNINGIAMSKDLPYGVYTVKQIKGKTGFSLMPAFDIEISKHAEVYSYIINNSPFKAFIDIVKKDAATGKVIPAAGVGFKVKNLATGKFLVQHINYPTPMDIEVFYTDSNGRLRLPEKLSYGDYAIIEQCTAEGYILDSEPVKFTVDGTQDTVTVEKLNYPQMGTLTVTKEGEIFSSVYEKDGLYIPKYETVGLKNAEFSVFAAEDIYTPDGTLRCAKGEKADSIITGEDGKATTKPLFLGKYEIRETKAPNGYVLTNEPVYAELKYAGQEVKITSTAVSVNNKRQKAVICLRKSLEKDETFSLGKTSEYTSVKFGLFAAERLTAADGSEIPADGLLEVISVDENGNGIFTADIPVGAKLYVKETATDGHYILSDEKYPVKFTYGGQDISSVQLVINDGKAIENRIIRGRTDGIKTDEDLNPIGKAVFGLFKPDETVFTESTALAVTESDENGAFSFTGIPYGKWIIKELSCPDRYVLSDKLYEVNITEDGEVLSLGIQNKTVTGTVRVIKLSKADISRKLHGAEFYIYSDTDNNGVFNPDTDIYIGRLEETENGIYSLSKLKFGGYFLYENKAPDGHEKDNRYFYFQIKKDGETVTVENEKGVGFVNEPIPVPEVPSSPKTGDIFNPRVFIINGLSALFVSVTSLIFLSKKSGKE